MNKTIEIPKCNYTIDDEFVTIDQDTHGDGHYIVSIHRSHVAMIANDLGLLGNGATLKRMVATIYEARDRAAFCGQMVEKIKHHSDEGATLEEEAVGNLLAYLDGVISMLPENQRINP